MALNKKLAATAFALALLLISPAAGFAAEPEKNDAVPPIAELAQTAAEAARARDIQKEMGIYKMMIDNYPKDEKTATAYFKVGQYYLDAKNFGSAQSYFSVVVNNFPASPHRHDALMGLATSLTNLRRYSEAESALQTALPGANTDAERATILFNLGDLRYRTGQSVKSVEAYVDCWNLPSDLHPKAESRVKEIIHDISSTADLAAIEEKYGNGFPAQFALLELAQIYRKGGDQLNLERTRERMEKGFPGLDIPKDTFVATGPSREYLTIGCILPLSGEGEEAGKQAYKGIQTALATKSQFVEKARIRSICKDSGGNADSTLVAMKELADDKSVIGVVGMFSPETLAPVLDQSRTSGLPIITPSKNVKVDTMAENKRFLYQVGITNAGQVRALVSLATGKLNIRTFAVLSPNDEYGKELAQMFIDAAEKSGGTIVAKAAYDPAQTDFRDQMNALGGMDDQHLRKVVYDYAQEHTGKTVDEINGALRALYGGSPAYPRITKVKSMPITKNNFSFELRVKYDAVFLPVSNIRQAVILPTLSFYNIKGVQVLGTEKFLSAELMKYGERDADTVMFTGEFSADLDKIDVKYFVDTYRNAWDEAPDITAAQFYDAMMMTIMLMENGADNRWKLSSGMDTLKYYRGATGGVYWGPEGIMEKMPAIFSVVNGKVVEYQAPIPPESGK